jgi:hypothetical protein
MVKAVRLLSLFKGWELERLRFMLLLAAGVEATAEPLVDADMESLIFSWRLAAIRNRRLCHSLLLASTDVLCAERDRLCAWRARKQMKRSCEVQALSTLLSVMLHDSCL